jgi:hypothetical protein
MILIALKFFTFARFMENNLSQPVFCRYFRYNVKVINV